MVLTPEEVRETLLDREKFNSIADVFVAANEHTAISAAPGLVYPESLRWAWKALYHHNSNVVFSRTESPIEKIFLNSLALCFISNSLPLLMMADLDDVLSYVIDLETFIPNVQALAAHYRKQGIGDDDLIAHFAAEVKKGAMTKQRSASWLRSIATYEWLNLKCAVHLSVQAGFPNIMVEGKSIRTDLFFWKPGNDDLRLVVECDGFEFHNSKEIFVRDRKRNRALQYAGIEVLRFSGTEIWHNPSGVANELFKYLIRYFSCEHKGAAIWSPPPF